MDYHRRQLKRKKLQQQRISSKLLWIVCWKSVTNALSLCQRHACLSNSARVTMSNLCDSLARTATISSYLFASCRRLTRLWWSVALSTLSPSMSLTLYHGATSAPSFTLVWRLPVENFTWTFSEDFSRNVSCSNAKRVVVTTFQFRTTKSSSSLVAWSVAWRKKSNWRRSWDKRRNATERLSETSKSSSTLRLNCKWTVNYFWITYPYYEVAVCYAPQAASAGLAVVCAIWQTSTRKITSSMTGPAPATTSRNPTRLRWIRLIRPRSRREWGETMARFSKKWSKRSTLELQRWPRGIWPSLPKVSAVMRSCPSRKSFWCSSSARLRRLWFSRECAWWALATQSRLVATTRSWLWWCTLTRMVTRSPVKCSRKSATLGTHTNSLTRVPSEWLQKPTFKENYKRQKLYI